MDKIDVIESKNDKVEVTIKKLDPSLHDVTAVRMAKDLLVGDITTSNQPPMYREDKADEDMSVPQMKKRGTPYLFIGIGYFFVFMLLSSVHPALAAAYFCLGFIAYFAPSFYDSEYRSTGDWRFFCFPWMAYVDYKKTKEVQVLGPN